MDSRIKNTKRNIVSGLANRVVSILLPFANRTAILWLLGAEFTGLSSLFSSVLSVLSISELGFNSAVVYSLYEPVADGDEETICETVSLLRRIYHVVGSVIFGFGLAVMPFLPRLIRGEVPPSVDLYAIYFIYLTNSALSYFLFAYKESLLLANQRQDVSNNIRSVASVLVNAVQLVVLLAFRNYYAYAVVYLAGTVTSNLMIDRATRARYPYLRDVAVEISLSDQMKRRVGALLIGRVCDVFRNSLDSIIVSSTIGLVATAIYGNYYYVYSSFYGVMMVFTNSMSGGVGNSLVQKGERENYDNLLDFSLIFSVLLGWTAAEMACLYQPFMELWAGRELILPAGDMLLFVLYFYVINMNNVRNNYISGLGMWWELRASYVAEAVGNVALNVALGRLMGIPGIVLASIITIFFCNYLMRNAALFRHYFHAESKFLFYRQQFYYLLVALAAVGCSYWVCGLVFRDVSLATLVGRAFLAGGVAACVMFVLYLPCSRRKSSMAFLRRAFATKGGHV